jgi:uncharacterized Fe-S cluster-containing radical SAM superfamily enzyme
MRFTTWLDTLISEKGYDAEHTFTVQGESGPNHIPLGCVVEALRQAPKHEQAAIKANLVRLDFRNADLLKYFGHLAQALAQ